MRQPLCQQHNQRKLDVQLVPKVSKAMSASQVMRQELDGALMRLRRFFKWVSEQKVNKNINIITVAMR
jgi:hypothetical protein